MSVIQPEGTYDNSFLADNVYGNALALLVRRQATPLPGDIHIDIGCGYGRIAEPLAAALGLTYVGIDGSEHGLSSLAERGFETHRLRLEGYEASLERLRAAIGNRTVASITFLDTIEHVDNGDAILRAIGEIARAHAAFTVVSTPNVTHRDIGAKLALGCWDYTKAGLLDHTHVRLFDEKLFAAALEQAGLHRIDRLDVVEEKSDQHFPAGHPALAAGSPLNGLLFALAAQANPAATVNQFVWLCAPGRPAARTTYTVARETARPFLSVLIRTQARRLHTLVETFTCLCGQTDTDFEVLLVGHRLDGAAEAKVAATVEDLPAWLRAKVRVLSVADGGRARPLNAGFAAAQGRYVSILDDDDAVMGNWVATFRSLAQTQPGCILRAAAARQEVVNVEVNARAGLRAEGSPTATYPGRFEFLDHLYENHSPTFSLAFPRATYHTLALRFDETLSTAEDWDFLMRAAACCGVAGAPEITGIYRWWTRHESSRSVHSESDWRHNREVILRKHDETWFILPKGEAGRIREMLEAQKTYRAFLEEKCEVPIAKTTPQDAAYWARRTARVLPPDVLRMVRRTLKRRLALLRIKQLCVFPLARKRRAYRRKITLYRIFLGAA